ncbi:MAG: hypothetical protein ACREA7_10305, partial [Nitrosotalea sp.]
NKDVLVGLEIIQNLTVNLFLVRKIAPKTEITKTRMTKGPNSGVVILLLDELVAREDTITSPVIQGWIEQK